MVRHAACLLAVLAGCPAFGNYPARKPIEPPTEPTPILGLNTEWDDYNAAKPPGLDQIIYSTNRGSQGKDLDVWITGVQWGKQPRVIGEPRPYAPELMSPADERGPLQMSVADFVLPDNTTSGAALVFSSARSGGTGGLDLYWSQSYPKPIVHRLEHLSSAANDAYLTEKFGEVSRPRTLFASDRLGNYDIYEALWDSYQIGGPPVIVKKLDALSSSADDSAPFVASARDYGTFDIVFASKRDGGRGGWDIWCSRYDGTSYSPPVLVEIANSEHDEFRPSIAHADARFLVFSSNRPSGRGGYDLYTVRFDGCPESK